MQGVFLGFGCLSVMYLLQVLRLGDRLLDVGFKVVCVIFL